MGVRPERFSLAAAEETAPAGPNSFAGRLDDEIYLGDWTDWRVRLGDEVVSVAEGASTRAEPQARRRGHGARAPGRDPPPRRPRSRARVNTRRQALMLLLPCALTLLFLFLLPQLLMFEASLGRRDAYGSIVREWSLGNYVRAVEPLYLVILLRSVVLALVTTVACLLVAWPVAYWLALRVSERWRSALLVLVILPFWTSFLVRMYAWVFALRSEGLVNLFLSRFGIGPLPLLYNDFAVLLGQVYGELPFMILPLYASLEKLDRSLLEAAADLGARPARTLFRVTLPLSAPGVVAGCILVFIPSLGAYLAPDLLGGARTVYIGNLIQSQFAVARDMPFGAALSFLLSLTVLVDPLPVPEAAARVAGGLMRAPGKLTVFSLLVYLFLYAPILVLVAFSFNKGRLTASWEGFTFDWYLKLLQNEPVLTAVRNSLIVGGAATVLATVLGTTAALALHRHRFRRQGGIDALFTLPIVVPEIVLASSLLLLFAAIGLKLGFVSIVLAHVAFSVSYAIVVVRARLAGFDRSLEEAAMDLGARPVADLLAGDPAPDLPRRDGGGPAGVRPLHRRLRHHVVRGRGGHHHPARADLLDGAARHHAGDQRRLHPAPRGHQPAPLRRPPPGAGGAGAHRPPARAPRPRHPGHPLRPRPRRLGGRAGAEPLHLVELHRPRDGEEVRGTARRAGEPRRLRHQRGPALQGAGGQRALRRAVPLELRGGDPGPPGAPGRPRPRAAAEPASTSTRASWTATTTAATGIRSPTSGAPRASATGRARRERSTPGPRSGTRASRAAC